MRLEARAQKFLLGAFVGAMDPVHRAIISITPTREAVQRPEANIGMIVMHPGGCTTWSQAGYIVKAVLENREAGVRLKLQAVLFRASHHSASLEVELTRRNIPFVKFGGLKFLEAAHVKDVLAVLRWAQNIRDRVAGFRVAQLLPGIGPSFAARLLDHLVESPNPLDALGTFNPPPAAAEHWTDFGAMLGMLGRSTLGWPAELDLVCRWYGPHLERIHEDAAQREADLVQLAQIAFTYPSRERFLTALTLDPPDATSGQAGVPLLDEDYLILSTIHSAKGQEWSSVFVLNAVDGCLPSDLATGSSAEIEEERRLLYVAMTRAKDQLHVMVPNVYVAKCQFGEHLEEWADGQSHRCAREDATNVGLRAALHALG
jgi:DNA helicase-2/ATP-dependent DNA helicase PcrA